MLFINDYALFLLWIVIIITIILLFYKKCIYRRNNSSNNQYLNYNNLLNNTILLNQNTVNQNEEQNIINENPIPYNPEYTNNNKLNYVSYILENDINKECSICIEHLVKGNYITTLECAHSYHKDCINEWLLIKRICPLCDTN